MNYQNYVKPFLACTAALAILFTGCSAKSGNTNDAQKASIESAPYIAEEAADSSAPAMEKSVAANVSDGLVSAEIAVPNQPAIPSERKIIKRSELSLETKEFDTTLSKLIQLVESSGGYIESQNTNGHSIMDEEDYYSRSAQISARIPADKLDQVTSSVGELCNIVSRNDGTDDITDTYFDSQAHLKVLQVQEERLLEILSKAVKLEDVVTLEKALSDVRYQIESLTAAIKRMDSQVTYSYLNLYLQEVGEYNTPVSTPKSFADRLSSTFSRSLSHVANSAQSFVLIIVEVLPVVLFWGIILAVIALIAYKVIKKSLVRKESSIPSVKPEPQEQDPNQK